MPRGWMHRRWYCRTEANIVMLWKLMVREWWDGNRY